MEETPTVKLLTQMYALKNTSYDQVQLVHNVKILHIYRPIRNWGITDKKAPTDMMRHPTAIIFGRWTFGPR